MESPIQLDALYFVAPQIVAEDLSELKAMGFERVINNRPDAESDGQPSGESLRVVAEALGLEYISNPIALPTWAQVEVDLQEKALNGDKKTLAFCRTGTRSSVLWVLLENSQGKEAESLTSYVSSKGFDLSRCSSAMAPLLKAK